MHQVSPYKLIPEEEFKQHWNDSEGRKPGCLGRISKPGDWCPMASNTILKDTIPQEEWETEIAKPTYTGLRKCVPFILDQDGVSSCATEMAAQLAQTIRGFNNQIATKLNPWFIYHTTSGGRDGGSNIDENLRFMREFGCAPQDVWPRSNGWRREPSEEAKVAAKEFKILEFYDIRNIEEFGTALLLGYPVGYGRRGHAITAVELIDRNTIIYANSWGNWGDEGFGTDKLSNVNFGYGAWAIRVVGDNTPAPVPQLSEVAPSFYEKTPSNYALVV